MEPTEEDAIAGMDLARRGAAARLPLVVEHMFDVLRDPDCPAGKFSTAADFIYKASGMAQRNTPTPTGSGFQLNIVLGKQTLSLEAAPQADLTQTTKLEFSLPQRDAAEARMPVTVDATPLDFDDE